MSLATLSLQPCSPANEGCGEERAAHHRFFSCAANIFLATGEKSWQGTFVTSGADTPQPAFLHSPERSIWNIGCRYKWMVPGETEWWLEIELQSPRTPLHSQFLDCVYPYSPQASPPEFQQSFEILWIIHSSLPNENTDAMHSRGFISSHL